MNKIIIFILVLIILGIIIFGFFHKEAMGPSDTPISTLDEFDNKIVYTTDLSLDNKLYKEDCQNRGGNFNQCGTICAPDADFCPQVCAYTCEFE